MDDPLSMTWQDVLFVHWAVDPETVAPHLPEDVHVDVYEGTAYVGLVPFRMVDLRTVGSPMTRTFAELNFRTYVSVDGRPGTYFFSLDAADDFVVRLSRWQGLPYFRAETRLRDRGDRFEFGCRRTHDGAPPARFEATYAPDGDLSPAAPDSLADFLVGRTRYYVVRDDAIHVGRVHRDHFEVADASATIRSNGMFDSVGMAHPGEDPTTWYAAPEGLDVTAGTVEPVERS